MKKIEVEKYKGSLIFKISIASLIIFVIGAIVTQQITIRDMSSTLDDRQHEIEQQKIINEDLQYSIDEGLTGDDAYVEQYARSELNFAKQGERVFVNIGGN